jgi:hypothetical protein
MVRFFELLGENSRRSRIPLLMCFSTRHYPRITVTKKVELILEDESGHSDGISQYIDRELQIGKGQVADRVRKEILERSSGVFLWVVLVVRIMNKTYDYGQIYALEAKLKEIPDGLHALFESILTRDDQNMEILKLCISWLLFAKRPLTREEFYYAILSGIHPELLKPWDPQDVTEENMESFMLSSSKGLAELTTSQMPTVQFIHESVRDFLLSESSMQYLWRNKSGDFQASAHERLKKSCENYIRSKCLEPLGGLVLVGSYIPDDIRTLSHYLRLVEKETGRQYQAVLAAAERFPFLKYTIQNILFHADSAAVQGISQSAFLKAFEVSRWVYLKNLLAIEEDRLHEPLLSKSPKSNTLRLIPPHTSLLYIIAMENLPALISALFRIDTSLDRLDNLRPSPILAALDRANFAALKAILRPTPDIVGDYPANEPARLTYDTDIVQLIYRYGDFLAHHAWRWGRSTKSLLWFLLEEGEEAPALAFLRSGRFDLEGKRPDKFWCSPLSYSAERGYENLVRFLISTHKVDMDSKDYNGRTALSKAATYGQEVIVELLLNTENVEINSRDNIGHTALSLAVQQKHEHVVELLLNVYGIDIDSLDNLGRTPFSYAAEFGLHGIAKLLLNTRSVNIESQDYLGRTPLSYAAANGHYHLVEALLDSQYVRVADLDREWRTPLTRAIENKHYQVVELFLLSSKIDVHSRDACGGTTSVFQLAKGDIVLTRLLLKLCGYRVCLTLASFIGH